VSGLVDGVRTYFEENASKIAIPDLMNNIY
jgi:hypothetical protein